MAFGSLVREARKHRGMSQVELAAGASYSQAELSRLEKGDAVRGAYLKTFLLLASQLEMDIEVRLIPHERARHGAGSALRFHESDDDAALSLYLSSPVPDGTTR